MDYQVKMDKAIAYIRQAVNELCDEYWEAYYWQRGRRQREGEKFDWSAGCRVKEREAGATLEWFVMDPKGKGKKANFHWISIYESGTRKETKEFSRLTQKEKHLIRSIEARSRELFELYNKAKNINQRVRWLDQVVDKRLEKEGKK